MFLTMTFLSMFLTAENDLLFLKFSGRLVFVSSFLTRLDYVSYRASNSLAEVFYTTNTGH